MVNGVSNGGDYGLRITEEDLAKSPSWTLRDDNPPIAARKALALASPVAHQVLRSAGGGEWKLQSAMLKPRKLRSGASKWYWVMCYNMGHRKTSAGKPVYFYVGVLMDGKVIAPNSQGADK